ncbi:MAG: four helix bundle protein [Bacteroidetes bacterium]|nr:four helix bundle protein [Bacteroidota bacterium]
MDNNHFIEEPQGKYNESRDFTSLVCWQNARTMKLFFYNEIIPKLPYHEKDNLIIQIKKASVSSTANIAEGYGRFHYQEGIQYYRISRGSIYELKDHILTCHDVSYINNDLLQTGIKLIETTKISLNGYIKYVKKRKDDDKIKK